MLAKNKSSSNKALQSKFSRYYHSPDFVQEKKRQFHLHLNLTSALQSNCNSFWASSESAPRSLGHTNGFNNLPFHTDVSHVCWEHTQIHTGKCYGTRSLKEKKEKQKAGAQAVSNWDGWCSLPAQDARRKSQRLICEGPAGTVHAGDCGGNKVYKNTALLWGEKANKSKSISKYQLYE